MACVLTAAAAPRIESVAVKPETGKGTEIAISVTIERPTPLDVICDAVVDPGDGSKFVMSWGIADRRTKISRYDYKKAGTYRLSVSGTGKDACVGAKTMTVNVGGATAPSRAESAAGAARCPSGWTLVEDSVKGTQYTCRARPPSHALRCAQGTSYFSERGEIGCR
jgi:hypothetical protein